MGLNDQTAATFDNRQQQKQLEPTHLKIETDISGKFYNLISGILNHRLAQNCSNPSVRRDVDDFLNAFIDYLQTWDYEMREQEEGDETNTIRMNGKFCDLLKKLERGILKIPMTINVGEQIKQFLTKILNFLSEILARNKFQSVTSKIFANTKNLYEFLIGSNSESVEMNIFRMQLKQMLWNIYEKIFIGDINIEKVTDLIDELKYMNDFNVPMYKINDFLNQFLKFPDNQQENNQIISRFLKNVIHENFPCNQKCLKKLNAFIDVALNSEKFDKIINGNQVGEDLQGVVREILEHEISSEYLEVILNIFANTTELKKLIQLLINLMNSDDNPKPILSHENYTQVHVGNASKQELQNLINEIQLFYQKTISTIDDYNREIFKTNMDNLIMEIQQIYETQLNNKLGDFDSSQFKIELENWMSKFQNFYLKMIQIDTDNDDGMMKLLRVEIEQLTKKIRHYYDNTFNVAAINTLATTTSTTTENDIDFESFFTTTESEMENLVFITATSKNIIETTTTKQSIEAPQESLEISIELEELKIYVSNFNEISFTYSDLQVLNQKTSNLINLSAKASGANTKMAIDKLIERANNLRERTQKIYLKNYSRLQQLMNIVKSQMNVELVYEGDMEMLDKHIEEINVLLPRMEVAYQSQANAFLRHYKDFKELMVSRNTAIIMLRNISMVLKYENLSNISEKKFDEFRIHLQGMERLFEKTEYFKVVEKVFKQLNMTIKTNYVFTVAERVLNAADDDFKSNLFKMYKLKDKLAVIAQTTKNEIAKHKAMQLLAQLDTRIKYFQKHQETVLMEKLMVIEKSLVHPESLSLKQLKIVSENLIAISKSVESELIKLKIEELMIKIREIQQTFQRIHIKFIEIERKISLPSTEDDLNELRSLLEFVLTFENFNEASIAIQAKELDASIKNLIYDYQMRNQMKEANHGLIEMTQTIEHTQTGPGRSEINDNIMKLQNLEIMLEDDDTDVQDVLEHIHRSQLDDKSFDIRTNAKMLEIIVDNVLKHIYPVIVSKLVEFEKQLIKLEQFNDSQVILSKFRSQNDILTNDTNRILMDLKDTREELMKMNLPPLKADAAASEIIRSYNGTSDIINQLLKLNNLLKDSQTSALYKATLKNVQDVEQIESALNETFNTLERLKMYVTMKNSQRNDDDDDGSGSSNNNEAIKNPTNVIIMNESDSSTEGITTENTTTTTINEGNEFYDENTYEDAINENQKLTKTVNEPRDNKEKQQQQQQPSGKYVMEASDLKTIQNESAKNRNEIKAG